MQIDGTPEGVWNLMEVILTVIFFFMGFYFFKKYKTGKEEGIKSQNDFNLGYAFFYWAIVLHQFFFFTDSIPNFIPPLKNFLSNGEFYLYISGLDRIGLKTQIVLMIVLLIVSATPLMKSIEKYLQQRENVPVYKATYAAGIMLTIVFIIFFVVNRGIAPLGFEGQELKYVGGTDGTPGKIINWFLIIFCIYILIIAIIIVYNILVYWLILTIKSPKGAFRVKSLLIFLGVLTLYIGLFVGNLLRPDLEGWLILIGPIFFLVGMVLLIIGFKKEIL